ncbi:aminotransferase-like domain-containing protein [Klenkia taihuensis]|uniref:GntR family transcriptional regulator / MocR family aminotransferase n=1 Tax=Klenkia taihuensis TaxID=1225127 RepID=A0A1I1JD92_9ACTN|nr:PLP-dependent aminotransferase family protein [Klenkia taihuensis]GHE10976.1 GntR family transcriptional regulator [Klenkia taihuensis]SFC46416.1 GntR family transcriptional regulator / MocR family aminotransferase [Klenkia taihuensis]
MTEPPPVVLDRGSGVPLAVQLADGLRGARWLRPGDRLPSTRELARALGVSRTVTAAAYDQLLAEGWVAGRRGVGTFVVGAAVPAAPATGRPPAEAGPGVDLRPGAPCTEVLDPAAWRRAWRAAGDRPPDAGYDAAGDPVLRAAVVDHLLRHRGLPADPGDVLAAAGTSAAVVELAGLLGPGARVGVEDPGYRRAVGALRAAGVEVVPLPVDDDGLVVDAVPAGLDAVYCTPAHQFPLGGRLPAARRTALVERARAEGFTVWEDDYDGELRYDVAPLPLLAALAPDVVVHLGTASKVLTPTLGLGWLVAPSDLRDRLLERRTATGQRPGRSGQRVFAALAASGDLARHLRRLRRELAARRELVRAAVAAAGHTCVGDAAGAHLVVPLSDRGTESSAATALAARGVAVGTLAEQSLADPRAGLVVGWAAPARSDLAPALAALTGVLAGLRR